MEAAEKLLDIAQRRVGDGATEMEMTDAAVNGAGSKHGVDLGNADASSGNPLSSKRRA